MKLRIANSTALLLLLGFVVVALAGEQTKDPLLGKPAPDFKLKDLKGKEWKLSTLKGKKVVLLDFTRIMCTCGLTVAKDVQKVHEKYEKRGLQVLAISLDPPQAERIVTEIIADEKLTFPFLRDVGFKVARDYKFERIPCLVLVDRLGKVRYVHEGYRNDLDKVLSQKIEPLLPKEKKK